MYHAGIDVSKNNLDVYCKTWEGVERYSNDKPGIKKLVNRIKGEESVIKAVMESTGGYERPVAKSLAASQVKVSVVNPVLTKNFARSLGNLAKTDAIDARMLAKYGDAVEPRDMGQSMCLRANCCGVETIPTVKV